MTKENIFVVFWPQKPGSVSWILYLLVVSSVGDYPKLLGPGDFCLFVCLAEESKKKKKKSLPHALNKIRIRFLSQQSERPCRFCPSFTSLTCNMRYNSDNCEESLSLKRITSQSHHFWFRLHTQTDFQTKGPVSVPQNTIAVSCTWFFPKLP